MGERQFKKDGMIHHDLVHRVYKRDNGDVDIHIDKVNMPKKSKLKQFIKTYCFRKAINGNKLCAKILTKYLWK